MLVKQLASLKIPVEEMAYHMVCLGYCFQEVACRSNVSQIMQVFDTVAQLKLSRHLTANPLRPLDILHALYVAVAGASHSLAVALLAVLRAGVQVLGHQAGRLCQYL